MPSKTKSPLLIFGMPLGDWHPLARSIIDAARWSADCYYEGWHRELFGAGATELKVGLIWKDRPKLEISEDLKGKMASPAIKGAAKLESAGVSVFGCWTADIWLKALPSATCLVFYEDPARMLGRCLAADPSGSPEALLSIWSAAAQKILSAIRGQRDRVYLLNAEECLGFGEEYVKWVQKHLEVSPRSDGGSSKPAKVDAPLAVFVEALCSESLSIKMIAQELEASSQPVCDEWAAAGSKRAAPTVEVALGELLALRQRNGGIAAQGREIERYREVALKKEEEATVATKELLALRQRIGEIEIKDREIEEYKQLVLRNQREALHIHELLFMELHEAFEESERHFILWRKSESSGGELSLKVGSVRRNDSIERSEHRHINYTFHDAHLFGRHWPTIHLRLVEHVGHAGIAVFCADSLTPPLYRWLPSGSESGRPFMLFVPADAAARDALVRATTSDLVFIRDSVALIHSYLCLHGLSSGSRMNWIRVAERLLEEIDEVPERLHYDSVRTEMNSPSDRDRWFTFDILNASFRGRIFPSLKVSWGLSVGGGRFIISLTDRARPPLSYWPFTDAEGFQDEMEVRRYWNKFTRTDKALLKLILAEIPNFLVHAAHQHSMSSISLKRLRLFSRMAGAVQPQLWEKFPSKPASATSR